MIANNNFVNDAYTEVFEEINNILNDDICAAQPRLRPPPLRRQPAMGDRFTPPLLTRLYPINAPNLEFI